MRYLPFYGKGVSFPFRIDPSTGRVAVSEGSSDSVSVALAYLNEESWTIREETNPRQNLIAEAIANILLTRQGEHDTLPEYGGDANAFIFDSISAETKYVLDFYFRQSTIRWEKRAFVPKGSVSFPNKLHRATYGELPVQVDISFSDKQPAGNLVAPYVDTSQARLAEYPSASIDRSKHDYNSRYYSCPVEVSDNISYNLPNNKKYIKPASDDYIYRVKYEQNWLDIAFSEYDDIRHWWIPANVYAQDSAESGLSWDTMYPAYELETGETLRLPSRVRVLNELSIDKYAG